MHRRILHLWEFSYYKLASMVMTKNEWCSTLIYIYGFSVPSEWLLHCRKKSRHCGLLINTKNGMDVQTNQSSYRGSIHPKLRSQLWTDAGGSSLSLCFVRPLRGSGMLKLHPLVASKKGLLTTHFHFTLWRIQLKFDLKEVVAGMQPERCKEARWGFCLPFSSCKRILYIYLKRDCFPWKNMDKHPRQ